MTVERHCQLDSIKNHHGSIPEGLCLKECPKRFNLRGKSYAECGQDHPVGRGPRMNKRRKGAEDKPVCFLSVGTM